MNIEKVKKCIQGRRANIQGHEETYKFAVLLPVVEDRGELCLLFERRAHSLEKQPGEICFPGGKIDPCDNSPREAALRETCEELGLSMEDIEYIAALDIMVSPFNYIIFPYVGYIKDINKININRKEVDSVFLVPVEYLQQQKPLTKTLSVQISLPEDYPYELIPHGRNYPFLEGLFPQYFYCWGDDVIWGMTSRIMHDFLTLVKDG